MDNAQRVKFSKFLSKHLRHQPEAIGLTLADGGWVEIDVLLSACASQGIRISHEQLHEIVHACDKQRFAIDDAGTRIRANQGHSTEVDLQLELRVPPATLYHGTVAKAMSEILAFGLLKMKRHHVHLSVDIATATKVGQRRGKPIILAIEAGAMHASGHVFFRSDNGVWLTDHVPPEFLRVME